RVKKSSPFVLSRCLRKWHWYSVGRNVPVRNFFTGKYCGIARKKIPKLTVKEQVVQPSRSAMYVLNGSTFTTCTWPGTLRHAVRARNSENPLSSRSGQIRVLNSRLTTVVSIAG